MRYLFVYQDVSQPARDLVERLGVEDVEIIIVRKGEREVSRDVRARLRATPGANAVICQVTRKYQRDAARLVNVDLIIGEFREGDRQLLDWLVPPATEAEKFSLPSESFLEAEGNSAHLVLARDALDSADSLAEHRHRFASKAANLLRRCANGEAVGPMRGWKESHGVDFAPVGKVSVAYSITCAGETKTGKSQWHLKEGDNTSVESAARVYFDRIEFQGVSKIVVFLVGPHPDDGEYPVEIVI